MRHNPNQFGYSVAGDAARFGGHSILKKPIARIVPYLTDTPIHSSGTGDAVTKPVVRFAYRNSPEDVIETKCEEGFAFAIGILVVAAMASVGSLVASIF